MNTSQENATQENTTQENRSQDMTSQDTRNWESAASLPSNSELRTRARLSLLGRYATVILATLLAGIVVWVVTAVFTFSDRSGFSLLISVVITFLLSVLGIMLDGGFDHIYLDIARERQVKVTDIFYCFRTHPDSAIRLSLLLAAVNLAASLPYLAALFLLPASAASLLTDLALLLLWIVPVVTVNLVYGMAFFLYMDEQPQSALSLMQKSRSLTRGHRIRLAGLVLSFIGYGLLGLISFGLGLLWVAPYFHETLAHFYLGLRHPGSSAH